MIPYIHTEAIHNKKAAREIIPVILKLIEPYNVIDIGCGTGTWLAVCQELGTKEILGVDGSYVDRSMLQISEDQFLAHDLTTPLNLQKKYDLALCLEVAEHLPEYSSSIIIDSLVKLSDTILFSAAIPGQGGQNHLNENWPSYWQNHFQKHGFYPFDIIREMIWDNDGVEWWYRQNIVMYASEKSRLFNLYAPSSRVLNYIHPELFYKKTDELTKIYQQMSSPSFNYLIRKILKKLLKPIFNLR